METTLMTPPATAAEPLPDVATLVSASPVSVPSATPLSAPDIAASIHRLEKNIAQVVRGKPEVIRLATVCLLARGHMLVQDVPGVGKTTLAQALARSLGLGFQRIQFTSDLLPSDIVGVSIFNQQTQSFEFVPGPLFGHVVLADEINRATPKTQSALLEAMSERKVSVDRKRYALPQPFLVLATQNPLEYHGTFPLPESQLDRFLMSLSLGYPPRDDERGLLLEGGVEERLEHLPAVLDRTQLLDLQGAVDRVKVTEKLADYLIALAEATRADSELLLGVSTRGLQGLYRASQALALCEGRAFVLPDDVQRLAPSVLGHRVILKRGGGDLGTARRAVERIVAATAVPV